MTTPEETPKLVIEPSKLPQLFLVEVSYEEVSYEVVVLSHSAEAAETYAINNADDFDEDEVSVTARKIREDNVEEELMDCLPYIATDVTNPDYRGEASIEEWLEQLEADKVQRKIAAEIKAKQLTLPGM